MQFWEAVALFASKAKINVFEKNSNAVAAKKIFFRKKTLGQTMQPLVHYSLLTSDGSLIGYPQSAVDQP